MLFIRASCRLHRYCGGGELDGISPGGPSTRRFLHLYHVYRRLAVASSLVSPRCFSFSTPCLRDDSRAQPTGERENPSSAAALYRHRSRSLSSRPGSQFSLSSFAHREAGERMLFGEGGRSACGYKCDWSLRARRQGEDTSIVCRSRFGLSLGSSRVGHSFRASPSSSCALCTSCRAFCADEEPPACRSAPSSEKGFFANSSLSMRIPDNAVSSSALPRTSFSSFLSSSSSSPVLACSPGRRLSSLASPRRTTAASASLLFAARGLRVRFFTLRPCPSAVTERKEEDLASSLCHTGRCQLGVFYSRSHEYARLVLERSSPRMLPSSPVSASLSSLTSSSKVSSEPSSATSPPRRGKAETENAPAGVVNKRVGEKVPKRGSTGEVVVAPRNAVFLSLVAYVGITSFAAEELGEVVYVEFPQALCEAIAEGGSAAARQCAFSSSADENVEVSGQNPVSGGFWVDKGTPICSMESVKSVAEAYSPVPGEVVEVNEKIKEFPKLVFDDPEGEGWLVKLQLSLRACGGADEVGQERQKLEEAAEKVRRKLLDEEQYSRLVEQEKRRPQKGGS